MWALMTCRMRAASLIWYSQPGALSCQMRVWPRTAIPWRVAQVTIASDRPYTKVPSFASVACHFMAFSGVTLLNSRATRAA
ncbi:putative hypothetical protein [Deinococcus grandis]|uniref:Uncharacterized protein n=1 Tax=Deinococcus grandis TaxID=57498 RepID=A0A100HLK6_9DEIO|nr:putative hypothetical protein [Deinococcus grandis]